MKNNLYFWLLICFLIIFFASQILIKSDITLGWDEGRHANAGHIWYDYYKTLLSGDFKSYETFLNEYEQKGYNAKWYGVFDPPFHGMWTGFLFLMFGDSLIIARLSILILSVLGGYWLYLLSRKILKKDYLALSVVILYMLSPLVWEYSMEVILEPAIATFFMGWYYFTFYRKKSKLDYVWAGLFLTFATLMKYHTIIFASVFMLVYFAYLLIKKNYKALKKYLIIYTAQGIGYLIIAGHWMWYSLIKNGVWERMLYEGTGVQMQSWLFYFKDLWPSTWGLIFLIIFVPFVWKMVNRRALMMVIVTLFLATFLIKNQQTRYVMFYLPFIYMFIILGIGAVSRKIRKNQTNKIIFAIFMIVAMIGSGIYCYKQTMDNKILMNGYQDYELLEYIQNVPEPKLLINLKVPADIDTTGYYYNPDQFIFLTMLANKEHNPILMKQFSYYVDLKGIEDPSPVIYSIESFQGNKAIVIFKYERVGYEGMIAKVGPLLQELNYTKTELRWWYVYEKK